MRDIPGGLGQMIDLRFDSFFRGHGTGTMLWNGRYMYILSSSRDRWSYLATRVSTDSSWAVPHEPSAGTDTSPTLAYL